jgi:hypothetical protein
MSLDWHVATATAFRAAHQARTKPPQIRPTPLRSGLDSPVSASAPLPQRGDPSLVGPQDRRIQSDRLPARLWTRLLPWTSPAPPITADRAWVNVWDQPLDFGAYSALSTVGTVHRQAAP